MTNEHFIKLKKYGLVTKRLENNIKNSPRDAELQMIVASFLLDNGFELEKLETGYNGKPRDIIVKNPFTIIETINMKDEEILRDAKPLQVINAGTINLQRICDRILEKISQLKGVSPAILIFGVPPFTEKDEFDDFFYVNKDIWQFPDNIDMFIEWRNKKVEFYIVNPNKKPSEESLAAWFQKFTTHSQR